jgi:hypothetical protein
MSIRAVHPTQNSSARLLRLAAILLAVATCLPAQHKVDTRQLYERLYAVVPLSAGKGTWSDPKRPMYAPSPAQMNPASRTGIIGFTHVVSDDGQFALVEFVARDAKAFDHILADINSNLNNNVNSNVKAFRKGQDKPEDIEAEFRKHKKDFSFEHFGVRTP